MRRSFLLAWRLQRWEIAALAVVCVVVSYLALRSAFRLDELLAGCRAAAVEVAPCGGLREFGGIYDTENQTATYLVLQVMAILPFAAGVILGVPLLSRELEHRTAALAWALTRSRGRWLAIRFVPVVAIGVLLLAVPAMAGEILERSLHPVIDPAASFAEYGSRGLLLVLRFLPVLIASALVGAWLGRQLPALLVACLVAGGMGAAVSLVQPYWVEAVQQPEPELAKPVDWLGTQYVGVRYRFDGQWISDQDAYARMRWDGIGPEPDPAEMPEQVTYVIPRERYPDVVTRESAALLGTGLLASGLLLVVVRRKRPG